MRGKGVLPQLKRGLQVRKAREQRQRMQPMGEPDPGYMYVPPDEPAIPSGPPTRQQRRRRSRY